jgi:hypothetical protein
MDRKIVEYKIVECYEYNELAEKVTEHIKDERQPYWPMYPHQQYSQFHQAMVKYEEE